MTDLTELGHRRDLLRDEIARLSRHSANIHKLTEDERMERVLELQDELRLVLAEIEKAAQAQNARHIAMVTPSGPVAENAQAELKAAQADLEKVMAGAEATMKGYSAKVHAAQVRYCDAANAAGNRTHRSVVLNGAAQKLAAAVEHAVRFGN